MSATSKPDVSTLQISKPDVSTLQKWMVDALEQMTFECIWNRQMEELRQLMETTEVDSK